MPGALRSTFSQLLSCLLAVAALLLVVPSLAAQASTNEKDYATANSGAGASWAVHDGTLTNFAWIDKLHHRTYPQSSPFTVVLGDGTVLQAADFRVEQGPEQFAIPMDLKAPRAAAHLPGLRWQTALVTRDGRLRAT